MTIILHYTHPKPGDENMSSATLVQNVSRSLVYLGDTGKLILGPQVFAVTLFPSGDYAQNQSLPYVQIP